ncbi:endonuclease domain-containing protein [Euzebya tangerina]|uniref:endonuclease domain-containing protein n=1 Tax=Euzebya tangerina TaxID=591198 RepID=UPI0013C309AF|nr:DUF559 domain-containing protein [Euzebya tangerina]
MPLVSASWAISDAAKTSSGKSFAQLTARGIGERWITLDGLRRVVEIRSVFPASGKLRRLLDELDEDLAYSGTERRVAIACRAAGIPVRLNQPIVGPAGKPVAQVDLCVDDSRLIVEIDGPHHWLPEVAAADRVRDRRLRSLGWTVIRFSVYEVDENLRAVVDEIARVHRQQQAA